VKSTRKVAMTEFDSLAGLDSVNWAELRHAYGPADNVPGLLRSLLSTSEEELNGVFYALYLYIYHQGSRYSASPAAVPFLYALLRQKDTPRRANLQRFLVYLAVGFPDSYVPRGVRISEWRMEVSKIQAPGYVEAQQLKREDWVAEASDEETRTERRFNLSLSDVEQEVAAQLHAFHTYEAVQNGLDTTFSCLVDESAAVRAFAIFALAYFPEALQRSQPLLLDLIAHDQDPAVRSTAMIALALLHAPSSGDLSGTQAAKLLKRCFEQNAADDLVRWSSAVSLCILRVPEPKHIQEVVYKLKNEAYLNDWEPENLETKKYPFAEIGLSSTAAAALMDLNGSEHPDATRALAAALPAAKGVASLPILTSMLQTAFNSTRPDKMPAFADLTMLQQESIQAIIEVQPSNWQYVNFTNILQDWGIPTDKQELFDFVGIKT
jgi:hypothetical protein